MPIGIIIATTPASAMNQDIKPATSMYMKVRVAVLLATPLRLRKIRATRLARPCFCRA